MFKKKNKSINFFQMMEELVGYSYEAALYMYETLENYLPEELPKRKDGIHEIEHTADIKKHELSKKLAREFITPIEREDINQLAEEIDNVTDLIDDVVMKLYMFNIGKIKSDAMELAAVVVKICEALKLMMGEFGNFRKSETLNKHIIEVNYLEEEGDRIYFESMRKLYRDSNNAIKIMIWSDIYGCLENCCDACEHVSDVVERVIMKNS